MRPLLLALLLAASPSPAPSPSASPKAGEPVILFLVDNSASLPPLDPDQKRKEALEKMFSFLEERPYRLILFGGRKEIFVDDPDKYNNRGQWTDFYFPFVKAEELMKEYPAETQFRLVLLTDAVVDPGPADWKDMDLAPGEDIKLACVRKASELLARLKVPLYVILVGDPPAEGYDPKDPEKAPGLVLELVRAANGGKASPLAQSLRSFFESDGLFLRKFVYRVAPQEGLKKIEVIVRRVASPVRPTAELYLGGLVLPLFLLAFLLLGILVRSYPGPGDVEVIELALGSPAHLAVDKLRKLAGGGWASTGLSLQGDARGAAVSLAWERPPIDLSATGFELEALDPLTHGLLGLPLDELRRTLTRLQSSGTKDERIYVLNLDYIAKNLDPKEAERTLTTPVGERRRTTPLDFLRAKAHLLSNDELRRRLTEPHLMLTTYGKDSGRTELKAGAQLRVGPYGFLVDEVGRGGRKDVRVTLHYTRLPALLKRLLPARFQRAFRLRRSSQRIVS